MKFVLSIWLLVLATRLLGQQSEFGWLIGTWQQTNKNSFEVWKDSSGLLTGSAYKVDQLGNKTVTEQIKLARKGNDFFFIADVASPQGPVDFKITSLQNDGFTAENLAHDFPKKIVYKKLSEQQLEATISADSKSVSYDYKKIK